MIHPRASLLTIGNELLKGKAPNTNAQFLGAGLADLGFEIIDQRACRDNENEIITCLEESLRKAALVVMTGGLGPTPDDLTRQAVAKFLNVPLIISQKQLSIIRRYYQKRGQKMPSLVKREALFPKTSIPLFNRHGAALGFYVTYFSRLMVVLPGVPDEFERMFRELVAPLARRFFPGLSKQRSLIVKTSGISEPEIMKRLGKNFVDGTFEFGIYPEIGEVTLRLYADPLKTIRKLKRRIRKRLGHFIFSFEDISLAEALGRRLFRKRKTLAVAESCTGGLLSAWITKSPGASGYFRGAVTAYSNETKETLLGVSRKTIAAAGSVSPEAAREMALGACRRFQADYGVGITGIAGPAGGSAKKPVGLVFVAVYAGKRGRVWREIFHGDRLQIQARAAKRALYYLWKEADSRPDKKQ